MLTKRIKEFRSKDKIVSKWQHHANFTLVVNPFLIMGQILINFYFLDVLNLNFAATHFIDIFVRIRIKEINFIVKQLNINYLFISVKLHSNYSE